LSFEIDRPCALDQRCKLLIQREVHIFGMGQSSAITA